MFVCFFWWLDKLPFLDYQIRLFLILPQQRIRLNINEKLTFHWGHMLMVHNQQCSLKKIKIKHWQMGAALYIGLAVQRHLTWQPSQNWNRGESQLLSRTFSPLSVLLPHRHTLPHPSKPRCGKHHLSYV